MIIILPPTYCGCQKCRPLMCKVRDWHYDMSSDRELAISSVSQGFSFTLPGRINIIFLSGVSCKFLHFASTEDWPLWQLQVMFLTETWVPTRQLIDTSSVNTWHLGAATTKVCSSSYWKMASPFAIPHFASFQEWYLWSANTRNL